jgi:hypothetical protein
MVDLRPFFGGETFMRAHQPKRFPWDRSQAAAPQSAPANDTQLVDDKWRIPIEAGWNVFPVVPGTKVPAQKWLRFQREHAEPHDICRWSVMNCNVAIVTGAISRLVVLDLDNEDALAEAKRRGLPLTVQAKTPRGWHFYFAHPGYPVNNRVGSLFKGADLKGDGGYVIAPGSVFQPSAEDAAKGKCAGEYAWLHSPENVALAPCPDWLLEALEAPQEQSSAGRERTRTPYADAAIEGELQRVRSAPEGSRNDTLYQASFKLGQLHEQLDVTEVRSELARAASEAGLNEDEVRATIESGWTAGRASPRHRDHQERGDSGEGAFRSLRLSPLENTRKAPPPFPFQVFGDKWGKWICTEAAGASAPTDYVGVGLLVAVAALIGNSRRVAPRDRWEEACVLWGCIVGDPSAGKTPALRPVFALLRPIDQAFFEAHRVALADHQRRCAEADATMQKWKKEARDTKGSAPALPDKAIAPPAPGCAALRVDDVTPEKLGSIAEASPKGLLMARDELAGWLGDMDRYSGSGERALWLTAWNGDFHRIDRQKSQMPIFIPNFSVSVLGGIQPDKFDAAFASRADDGLISRFLFAWPDPVPRVTPVQLPWGQHWPPAAIMRLLSLQFAQDPNGNDVPKIIKLSRSARAIFEPWWIAQQSEKVEGLAKSAWGKMPGQMVRIALVLEFLWWSEGDDRAEPQEVSVAAVEAAITLVDTYFKPMALRVFGEAATPADIAAATMLARFIASRRIESFNARDLQRGAGILGGRPAALKDHTLLMKACNALVDAGWLLEDRSREGDTKGRERRDYLVNPALWAELEIGSMAA